MTLFSIFKRYHWRISFTLLLVFSEAVAMLLVPLVIGFAVDGLLAGSSVGMWQLAAVGLGVTVFGSLRRLYDTRIYAGIHVDLSSEIADGNRHSDTSTLNARITMLEELTAFFEDSFPDLINSLIGLIGTVIILYSLDIEIFFGCLVVLVVMFITFRATAKRTKSLNHHYNNELEQQVAAIENRNNQPFRGYISGLMRWQIKLSDLETLIFGVVWLAMVALIVFSVSQAVGVGKLQVGGVMAIVMYVFQFAEGSGMLPLYYQQFLRLQEISGRLNATI